MPDTTPKPISRWTYGAFLAYFAALLPALVWGLWRVIETNTRPGAAALAPLTRLSTAADSAAHVIAAASEQTRLVLSQGDMLLVVVLAGAIGSYIHSVNSFITYVGNRSFVRSWIPWYALRPFMGVAMALVFYVVIRGGVLVLSGGVSEVDPYAIMTVAALAGMFSKQASDKLAEVFDTMFRSAGDEQRGDKVIPAPKVTALEPAKITAGAGDTTVTVQGEGFVKESVVKFDGADRDATFKSATELTFQLLAADVATAGEHTVAVFNKSTGGGQTSTELKLTVEAAPTPAADPATPDAAIQVDRVITAKADGSIDVVSSSSTTTTTEPSTTATDTTTTTTATEPSTTATDTATTTATDTATTTATDTATTTATDTATTAATDTATETTTATDILPSTDATNSNEVIRSGDGDSERESA